MKNIIIIGFMGVGKGRTARELAARTARFAVDTDDLIESMAKMKIRNIFAEHGEAHFRELELQAARWLEYHVTGTVVSTGGGFFQVKNINRLGRVVYLHSSVESILESMQAHPRARKKIKKRPLLKNMKAARKLFNERLPRYRERADIEILVENRTIPDIVTEIISTLR
ncbi:MAG: shikimate kinase [Desulfobulbus sp.]|nr:MAG: shikimate kinase [Desulfobulbus sp.]